MTEGFVDKWKDRRRRKKARLAEMTRGRRIARRVGVLTTWFLAATAFLMVVVVIAFYTLSRVPSLEEMPQAQVATITYSDGTPMASIGPKNRIPVKLDKIPEHVQYAVLAAEDRGFYTSSGVSIKGTLRAALNNVRGGDTQGGSGITQQYAKNVYLTQERTLSRKLKQLAIAVKLDRQYSKSDILEGYLNVVYFGRGAYGVEAAAKTFFGKSISKVNVTEAALLAALLRAPSFYDPAENPEAARDRIDYVLGGMVEMGKLTAAEFASLKGKLPRTNKPTDGDGLGAVGPTGLIVERVLEELRELGIDEGELSARGLKVQTTIDRKAQSAALGAIRTVFGNLTPEQKNTKGAFVAVNPANGGVLAYYGGPNNKADKFDWAGQGWRPPGSSFKPFTLAAALDLNLKKEGVVKYQIDSRVDGSMSRVIDGVTIRNSPGLESCSSASVTLRKAMECSLNTAFDGLAYDIGPSNVAKLAWAAGIPKTRPDGAPVLSDGNGFTGFSIGIGDYEVRPIDMAASFATLANGGITHKPFFVAKVVAADGEVRHTHKNSPKRAMDPKVTNDTTLTMMPISSSSGYGLSDGRPNASKTGTKGIEDGEFAGQNSDAWTVGFTPQVSAAAWVGSGSNAPVYSAGGGQEFGADMPGTIWKRFMDEYLTDKPVLPMPTTKMILEGTNVSTSPTATPTPTTSSATPTTSSAPPPPPPPTSETPTPTPSDTPTPTEEPSPTCTPKLLQPCPSSPPPPPPPPASSGPTGGGVIGTGNG